MEIKIENKIKLVFNTFLFLWILSIPYKNVFYFFSITALILTFIIHVIKFNKIEKVKQLISKYSDILKIYLVFILLILFSTMINLYDSKQFVVILMHTIRYALIFFILLYFYKMNFFSKNLFYIYLFCSLILLMMNGYYQIIFTNMVRIDGNVFSSNAFGLLMSLGMSYLTIILFDTNTSRQKILIFILSLLGLVLLVKSGSRSSWLMYFSFILFYLSFNLKRLNFKNILIAGIFIFLSFLVIYFDSNSYKRFILLTEGYSSNRFDIWLGTLDAIKERFLLGYGIDSLRYFATFTHHTSPHNNILLIFITIGLFGFIVFNILLFRVLKEILKNKKYGLLSVFISYLVVSLFDNDIFTSKVYLSSIVIFSFLIFENRIRKKYEEVL